MNLEGVSVHIEGVVEGIEGMYSHSSGHHAIAKYRHSSGSNNGYKDVYISREGNTWGEGITISGFYNEKLDIHIGNDEIQLGSIIEDSNLLGLIESIKNKLNK